MMLKAIMFGALFCCVAATVDGQELYTKGRVKDGNKIVFKENTFEILDKVVVRHVRNDIKQEWHKEEHGVRTIPVTMNGRRIYTWEDSKLWLPVVAAPGNVLPRGKDLSLSSYLLKALAPLADTVQRRGFSFVIENVVIDEAGRIVYYDYYPPYRKYNKQLKTTLTPTELEAFNNKVVSVLNNPKLRLRPAVSGGSKVPYRIDNCIGFRML